jgi:hypothetical protein
MSGKSPEKDLAEWPKIGWKQARNSLEAGRKQTENRPENGPPASDIAGRKHVRGFGVAEFADIINGWADARGRVRAARASRTPESANRLACCQPS